MIRSLKRQPRTPFKGAGRDPKGVVPHQEKENIMKKFAVAAALLSAVVAVPAMAANGGEARAEVRGGYVTGSGLDDAPLGAAGGSDFALGATTSVRAEHAGDTVLKNGLGDQFSSDERYVGNEGVEK